MHLKDAGETRVSAWSKWLHTPLLRSGVGKQVHGVERSASEDGGFERAEFEATLSVSQVVSSAALQRMAGLRADSAWVDNVLLEWILILELMECG